MLLAASGAWGTTSLMPPGPVEKFIEQNCVDCHDDGIRKGDLDLTTLAFAPQDSKNFALWVKVHDRVADGDMPPKDEPRPSKEESDVFLRELARPLVLAERNRIERDGRAVQRRLNRFEYENALRDLLHAPWLQVRDQLPEDGEAHRFNKAGEALDFSHVQLARYLAAAETALRQVLAPSGERPSAGPMRYYTRDQPGFTKRMLMWITDKKRPERVTFPVIDHSGQPEVRRGKAPLTAPVGDPQREREAMAMVSGTYDPMFPKFDRFQAPASGRYRLRISAYSIWAGAQSPNWWLPDLDTISKGRRDEPVTIYSELPPQSLRRLGAFDATPEPQVHELEADLVAGETIQVDASRLFRSRSPGPYRNPLAEMDGQPGVAYRWMEVEGPLHDSWPTAGHRVLFGDLPIAPKKDGAGVEVQPRDADAAARQLLEAFLARAYRRPLQQGDVDEYLPLVHATLTVGGSFVDAMIGAYSAVLASPEFVCVREAPGTLDDHALAVRLALFLTNSPPDDELRAAALRGELRKPERLRSETSRLLASPRGERFQTAFLDYWLDLRKMTANAADATLYNDYYLDDLLDESARLETQAFFAELVRGDLPVKNLIASDFTFANERLARHYGLPPVSGVQLRRVALPPDSPRGGLLTQASVLKVTANGTTTSPVLRGAWVMERILGRPIPPPPSNVPAVEPDIRGAHSIREQLAAHRDQPACASCHAKMDPAGFALESFDVLGGWRERYRAVGDTAAKEQGIGRNGYMFAFHYALPVEAHGELPDGRAFKGIRDFKQLLLADERQIARAFVGQLVAYATGSPVGFADRTEVEAMLDRAAARSFGVRTLLHELVQSELFRRK